MRFTPLNAACPYFTGASLDQNDATKREKYLKSYHGKMFLKRRLKSYLTG
jgi:putative endonuclease